MIDGDNSIKLLNCYKCNDCNNSFYCYKDNQLDNCCVCNSKNIESIDNSFFDNPMIIKFNKSLSDAKKVYKRCVLYNPLIPLLFKNKNSFNSIKKVYLPVYQVSVNISGEVVFFGGDRISLEKSSTINKYEVESSVNIDYDNTIINVSSINDKMFYSINDYNYDNLDSCDVDSLLDTYILFCNNIDSESNTIRSKINSSYLRVVEGGVPHEVKRLKNENTNTSFQDYKLILVPVYLLNIKYKNRDYLYIMNGDTGRYSVQLPVGVFEVLLFSCIIFVLIFLLGLLISGVVI